MEDYTRGDRGTYYLILGWTLTGIAIVSVILRLYSRTLLTRSAGSDDFTILFPVILTLVGELGDTFAVRDGLGRHVQLFNDMQLANIAKWECINLIMVFISFFFLRASVMLFTLRLMPSFKKWSQRTIYVSLFFNFAITMLAVVSYGVQCVPCTVKRHQVPGRECSTSAKALVVTQQVNGILACVIDIITALIPELLLWKLRIKRKTKLILNIIFALGIITSALSIGRAATTNDHIWNRDITWAIMPPNTFSLVEEKCGIIFASCPALRQLFAYYSRTGTFLPTQHRPAPNSDFSFMRERVKIRDVFWLKKPGSVDLGQFQPAGQPLPLADHGNHSKHPHRASNTHSPLDVFLEKVKGALGAPAMANRQGSVEGAEAWTRPTFRMRVRNAVQSVSSASGNRNSVATMKEIHSIGSTQASRQASTAATAQGWLSESIDAPASRPPFNYQSWASPTSTRDHALINNRISEERTSLQTFLRTESDGPGCQMPRAQINSREKNAESGQHPDDPLEQNLTSRSQSEGSSIARVGTAVSSSQDSVPLQPSRTLSRSSRSPLNPTRHDS